MSHPPPVPNPAKLEALHYSGLLKGSPPPELDLAASLAARTLNVPMCLVSLVDSDRQVLVGAYGLPKPYGQTREMPLSHSFCQHILNEGHPLIVPDVRKAPHLAENVAVADLGLIACLGFPLVGPDHHPFGAMCLIDARTRDWTEAEIETARDFASLVSGLIELLITRHRESTLLDVVIHDLKSPLAAVQMASHLLRERSSLLPGGLLPLVEALGESSDQAAQLVESLARRNR